MVDYMLQTQPYLFMSVLCHLCHSILLNFLWHLVAHQNLTYAHFSLYWHFHFQILDCLFHYLSTNFFIHCNFQTHFLRGEGRRGAGTTRRSRSWYKGTAATAPVSRQSRVGQSTCCSSSLGWRLQGQNQGQNQDDSDSQVLQPDVITETVPLPPYGACRGHESPTLQRRLQECF